LSTDLRELYQEVILDHQRNPRNFRAIPQPDRVRTGHNPLCGDKVTVYLKLADGVVYDLSFQGVGCAICTSSASLMTEHLKGKSIEEIDKLFGAFHTLLTDGKDKDGDFDSLGKLRVFEGVRQFPVRVKCATLPWHTLRATIEGNGERVSTE
jgi:nitrogen fixation protein NifU and related proteins